jgi:predicted esterase
MMSQATLVCFSHGKESGPWGAKISAMAETARGRGCRIESLDYRGMEDPGARVRLLTEFCRELGTPPVLVGSSMGGHVAASAAAQLPVAGLFLIAPAFYMPGYEALTPEPSCPLISVVHGWHDEVVPAENSIRWSREHGAELHLIPGDHRLTSELERILELFEMFLERVRAG